MRRLLLAVIVAAIAVTVSATEPDPSARQKEVIERVLQAMNIDQVDKSQLDSIFAQIQKQLLDNAVAEGNDPDDIEEAEELFTMFREHASRINFAQLLHDARVRIFAKYFTEKELTDIAAFYQSPTGKKLVEVTPQLLAESMKVGQDDLGPKLDEAITQAMNEQERKHPWRRTMSDIRSLATTVELYHGDQQEATYPQELTGITMSQKFPAEDIWGHAYEYVVSPDRHHYRIVSAGADGIFELDTRKFEVTAGATASVRYRDRLEDDIIYQDGAFLQLPVQAKPEVEKDSPQDSKNADQLVLGKPITADNAHLNQPHYSIVVPSDRGWYLVPSEEEESVECVSLELRHGPPEDGTARVRFMKNDVLSDRLKAMTASQVADDYRNQEKQAMIERGVDEGLYSLNDVAMGVVEVGDKTFYTMSYTTSSSTENQKATAFLYFPRDKDHRFFIMAHYSDMLPRGGAPAGSLFDAFREDFLQMLKSLSVVQ